MLFNELTGRAKNFVTPSLLPWNWNDRLGIGLDHRMATSQPGSVHSDNALRICKRLFWWVKLAARNNSMPRIATELTVQPI